MFLGCVFAALLLSAGAQEAGTNLNAWISHPLSLVESLNFALAQNATILKAKNDLEAAHGVVVQTRAIALPHLQATGQYKYTDPNSIETISGFGFSQKESWNGGVRVVQSIYEGGKIVAALRAAKATKQQALANYQTVVADVLLNTRLAYYAVLLGAQQITVHEASVKLLQKELEDQQHRYNAGTVPKFNLLRAEVAVANERPNLIRARNAYRVAKNNLANQLGYNLPREIWEDIPLNLSDTLEAAPYDVNLPDAIQHALGTRTELTALRKAEELQRVNVVSAKAGYKPSVQLFAGYGWQSRQFTNDLSQYVDGWNAGAQVTWDIFDGLLTRGKVIEAKAQHERSKTEIVDQSRQVELEVRTQYSTFIEAREVLESQKTVQAEAEEALREARARTDAGTGTQLEVLDAETALTQSRTTQILALHDYAAARARLERAIGADLAPPASPTNP
jgi:outer membrane protein TolC